MSRMPKTFTVGTVKKIATIQDAKAACEAIVREIDQLSRYIRADIEKIESRLTSIENRVTDLETP